MTLSRILNFTKTTETIRVDNKPVALFCYLTDGKIIHVSAVVEIKEFTHGDEKSIHNRVSDRVFVDFDFSNRHDVSKDLRAIVKAFEDLADYLEQREQEDDNV